MIKPVLEWWQHRRKLKALWRQLEAASADLDRAYTAVAGKSWEVAQQAIAEEDLNYKLVESQFEEAHHKDLIRQARRLRGPVPPRLGSEPVDWEETYAGAWVLTDDAAFRLRQSIAAELDARQKPYLNWAALTISGLSLALSIVALIWGK